MRRIEKIVYNVDWLVEYAKAYFNRGNLFTTTSCFARDQRYIDAATAFVVTLSNSSINAVSKKLNIHHSTIHSRYQRGVNTDEYKAMIRLHDDQKKIEHE